MMAQNKLPSLLVKLKKAPADTIKALIIQSITEYYRNIKPDSAGIYARQGLQLSEKLNFVYGKAAFSRFLAELDLNEGKMDAAKQKFGTAMILFEQTGRKKDIASVHNGLGAWAIKQGDYPEATKQFLTALKTFEAARDNAGAAYEKLGNF